MSLSPKELSFVEKREKLAKYWPLVGVGILFMLSALAVWLWVEVPHLINPWAVSASLEAGALPEATMIVMAAMLPIVMLAFLVFVAFSVILMFVAFSNESRLIRLIRILGVHSGKGR